MKISTTLKSLSVTIVLLLLLPFVQGQIFNNFNLDWKFHKGDFENAEWYDFDDSDWRDLDLPHDWSIEDLPKTTGLDNRTVAGPFDSKAEGGIYSGYTVGGIGWYRKHFKLPQSDTGKVIYINFDGIYMNSTIWINGIELHNQPYGYSAFWINLSDHLKFGDEENIIAIKVKNTNISSRWYAGSGIYRNVSIRKTGKIHFEPWGVFVTTPDVSKS